MRGGVLFRCSKMSGKHKANFALWFSWSHENDRYKRIRKDLLPYFVLFCIMEQACKWVSNHHPTGQACRVLFSLFALCLTLQVLFSVFTSQIDSCNEKWEAIKKKRSEAGKKSGESRRNKSEQTRTKRTSVPFVEQTQTNANKSEQTRTKRTVTDTVTGTVTVPVTNKPPDGTAPNGAAPPAKPARK